jgi:hypothetical protein
LNSIATKERVQALASTTLVDINSPISYAVRSVCENASRLMTGKTRLIGDVRKVSTHSSRLWRGTVTSKFNSSGEDADWNTLGSSFGVS